MLFLCFLGQTLSTKAADINRSVMHFHEGSLKFADLRLPWTCKKLFLFCFVVYTENWAQSHLLGMFEVKPIFTGHL